jgi:hypothetical protein
VLLEDIFSLAEIFANLAVSWSCEK